MTTLQLDKDFNYISEEELFIIDGCDEVAQNVRACISLIPEESCVFPDAGIDFVSPLYRDERISSQLLQTKIQNVDGVDFVSLPTLLVDGRNARYNFNVTIDGELITLGV